MHFGDLRSREWRGQETGQNSSSRGVRGCAVGCLIVACLALVVGAVVYRRAVSQLTEARAAVQERFALEYAALQDAGKIPEADRALVEGLAEVALGPEAGVFGVTAVSAVLRVVFEDGAVAPNEREMLDALKRMMDENPAPSLLAITRFRDQFPELRQLSVDPAAPKP